MHNTHSHPAVRRQPFVSFLYARGWRQNFAMAGFPGPEAEFDISMRYLAPVLGGTLVGGHLCAMQLCGVCGVSVPCTLFVRCVSAVSTCSPFFSTKAGFPELEVEFNISMRYLAPVVGGTLVGGSV